MAPDVGTTSPAPEPRSSPPARSRLAATQATSRSRRFSTTCTGGWRCRDRSATHSCLCVTVVAGLGSAVPGEALPAADRLPPGALRGLAQRLHQYPILSLATPAQRRAAEQLLAESRAAVRPWRDPRAGDAAGFDIDSRRARTSGPIRYFHAEHRRFSHDRLYLDPRRPESLIYADVPGRPLVLVGVMFALPRGVQGASPAARSHAGTGIGSAREESSAGSHRGLTVRAHRDEAPERERDDARLVHSRPAKLVRDMRPSRSFVLHACCRRCTASTSATPVTAESP